MSPGATAMVTRAVVVGSGSAGQRHAAMLRQLLPETELMVVRRAGTHDAPDTLRNLDARLVSDVDVAADLRPEVAVVAGPASFHRGAVEAMLDAGAHVLVEKPLAATVGDARSIAAAAASSGRGVIVGYHLRFGDTVPALAAAVRGGLVGPVERFRFEVGQHLDQWRPGTDPRRSVSARAELGGGVLLELSHELDGVRFVVGDPVEVTAVLSTDGAPTDGKVETVADLRIVTDAGITGEVHLDMTSREPFRRWSVTGPLGTLDADLLAGRVRFRPVRGGQEVLAEARPGERQLAEERLIRHLLDVATTGADPACTVADGLAAVVLADAARVSAMTGHPVRLQPFGSAA